jgi:hypothetical protein
MDRKDIAGDLRHIAHEVKARHLDGTLSEAILGLCRSIEDETAKRILRQAGLR